MEYKWYNVKIYDMNNEFSHYEMQLLKIEV